MHYYVVYVVWSAWKAEEMTQYIYHGLAESSTGSRAQSLGSFTIKQQKTWGVMAELGLYGSVGVGRLCSSNR